MANNEEEEAEEEGEETNLLSLEKLFQVAAKEQCWKVLSTLSRLYEWTMYVEPKLEEMPEGIVALYLFHSAEQSLPIVRSRGHLLRHCGD